MASLVRLGGALKAGGRLFGAVARRQNGVRQAGGHAEARYRQLNEVAKNRLSYQSSSVALCGFGSCGIFGTSHLMFLATFLILTLLNGQMKSWASLQKMSRSLNSQ